MSNNNQFDPKQLTEDEKRVYRESLEEQANLLKVDFHPSISDEKLLSRVKAAKEGSPVEALTDEESTKPATKADLKKAKLIPQSELELKLPKEVSIQEQRNDLLQQERVIVTCHDPVKKEWQGEILEVSNNSLGKFKKFIPFGSPWYVPKFLITMLESKQYQRFFTRKDKFGNETRYGKQEKAFTVSRVGNLNAQELAELKKKQMARVGEE